MAADGTRSRITVDGEEFEVVQPPDSPGSYELTWVSGRDPRYGFAFRTHPPAPVGRAELEEAVRDFLAQVDPATGYIE
ncbi:hypothetical protein Stsp02_29570 [Streptomyces sp. NBRC 14336]|uniref:hypothetical protein n=1 Tax=Streptomyces sp. NBRC 14336 TaxID=3030992 RepID=UPI0024A38A03|nr:hypothetical protein [Streptomyces sp. NBRC 14336]WBO82150.1 DUF687 domain-containing protein [Streptomyces sp. SBE_14.2]GLW47295.1 hypothetical protein Stsp02_29570 [Streptomyces sp. NBRC 14336]